MSLAKQISEFKSGFVQNVPAEVQSIMAQATQDLTLSGIIDNAPKVSEKLSSFTLSNQVGKKRNLEALLDKGPLVITFYRGGWCPYCNLELKSYQDALEKIESTGATLIAITPELPDNSLSTLEKNALTFEILTDNNSDYAREIGLVFTLPEALRPIYDSFGIHIEEHNGTGQFDLPLAATFVVAQNGTIINAFVDADYTKRQDPSDVVSILESI